MDPVRRARVYVGILTTVFVVALTSPAFSNEGENLFPLSDYPMFATRRAPMEDLTFAEVRRANGVTERVELALLTGGGPGAAHQKLSALSRMDSKKRKRVCQEIAANMKGGGELWIVRGTFSLERLRVEGSIEPLRRKTITHCDVPT